MKNSGSRFTTRHLSGVTAAGVRSNIYDNTLFLPLVPRGSKTNPLLITRVRDPRSLRRADPGSSPVGGDRRAQGVHHGPFGLLVFVF